jgi:predicted GNAT superfamily acetyltransferase
MKDRIAVRPLETLAEFEACHGVQKEAWAFPDLLIIPYTQLVTIQQNGGIVLGAFDGPVLIAFVFGYLGRLPDLPRYLYSQRMGVLPGYQGQGIGEQLKWAQRAWALQQGIDQILWTYDPLEPPNAWLNITKLGGIVHHYKYDIYGQHNTPLHDRLPSDRFVLEWELENNRVLDRLAPGWKAPDADVLLARAGPPINTITWDERGLPISDQPNLAEEGPIAHVHVPANWQEIRRADIALAADWRAKTRQAFEHYLSKGHTITGYARVQNSNHRCNFYLLEYLLKS